MEQARANDVIVMPEQSNDRSKLIRKLRWIGMEEEARRLQRAAGPKRYGVGRTVQHRLVVIKC